MTRTELSGVYRGYVACLNGQDWTRLDQFVDDKVIYNGQRFGVERYRRMLENDFFEIPDLHFTIELMISEPPYVASRLGFNCTPKGMFLGLHVAGRRVLIYRECILSISAPKDRAGVVRDR